MYTHIYQDVACPYFGDPRHPPDTLFLVAESDFRLCRGHCCPNWLDDVSERFAHSDVQPMDIAGEQVTTSEEEEGETGGAPRPPPFRDVGKGATGTRYQYGPWQAQHLPEAADVAWHEKQELADLIRIATLASRANRGDLIWYGYSRTQPNEARPSKPALINFGSQLIAVTAKGAVALKEALDRAQPGHFDLAVSYTHLTLPTIYSV